MKKQYVFFDEWFMPDMMYIPARRNDKPFTTLALLLKQFSKEPKPISPYRYKDAIYKTIKPIRTDPEYKTEKQINYEILTKIAQELNFEQIKKYLETGIQAEIRKEFERMEKNFR